MKYVYCSKKSNHNICNYEKLPPRKISPLNVTQIDVNNDSSVNDAINNIVKENGRIDILVNNAGYDFFGPLEESSLEEIKRANLK